MLKVGLNWTARWRWADREPRRSGSGENSAIDWIPNMYSLIQLVAIFLFLLSFFIPFMWLWGHVAAVFLFFMASMSARSAARQEDILRELQRRSEVEKKR